LEAFLEMLAAERGAARLTLTAYRNDLADLAKFLAARRLVLEAADAAVLHDYLAAATTRSLSPRTLARRLSAMRQFFRFLLVEGIRADDPTAGLDSPRLGRPLPKMLTETEVEQLIAAAEAWPGDDGIRLRCLLEMLYATGLRVSELITLPLAAAQRDRVSCWCAARAARNGSCRWGRRRERRSLHISSAATGFCPRESRRAGCSRRAAARGF